MSDETRAEAGSLPAPPDTTAVNEAWGARPSPRPGWRGLVARLVVRLLGPELEAQRRFDAAQVQLDNALVDFQDARFAATHRHYDGLLSALGRRQDEIDERHRQLERELLRHVQDLATRIDLVLGETNREKQVLRGALEETRTRLAALEAALRRNG